MDAIICSALGRLLQAVAYRLVFFLLICGYTIGTLYHAELVNGSSPDWTRVGRLTVPGLVFHQEEILRWLLCRVGLYGYCTPRLDLETSTRAIAYNPGTFLSNRLKVTLKITWVIVLDTSVIVYTYRWKMGMICVGTLVVCGLGGRVGAKRVIMLPNIKASRDLSLCVIRWKSIWRWALNGLGQYFYLSIGFWILAYIVWFRRTLLVSFYSGCLYMARSGLLDYSLTKVSGILPPQVVRHGSSDVFCCFSYVRLS